MSRPILEVKNLSTSFFTDDGEVKAVRDVSFELYPGETLGIVGESGCGKSVTAMSILGLVQRPGKIVGGQVLFKDRDLVKVSSEELRQVRGRDIAMIFQDPLSSMNPVLRIGFQIDEAMKAHNKIQKDDIGPRGIELLKQVRVPDASQRIKDYPHQFSGGMRQRAMIAMGLSNRPEVLIADEPTTALDVTVQAQILELLRDLNQDMGTSIILITHNLGVVAGLCKRVVVMYAGEIVEEGPVEQIFENPQHPYTWSLLRSLPRVDSSKHERLRSIEGLPPDLIAPPPGCEFNPRCPFRIEKCFSEDPDLVPIGNAQHVACWVTMTRAFAEMGAATITDTRPGAASGVRPPKDLLEVVADLRTLAEPEVLETLTADPELLERLSGEPTALERLNADHPAVIEKVIETLSDD
ncbi:MAG TPA: oligopeptide/dipeptide ABC transporter ATP-binding protein [Candidatus Acidoferrales bacterium]|nr:oligopeptide/dipeptide ABC transporter ATP-binding protein [Candidatus Acidoferrales bacterium]